MNQQILEWVHCPACTQRQWVWRGYESQPVVCGACGRSYRARNGILDLLPSGPHFLTPAQRTNFTLPVAWGYEDLWRRRSLTLLSGRPLPVDRELALLDEWLASEAPGLYLDLACSHALYGRSVARSAAVHGLAREVIAVDSSLPMLWQASRRILRANLTNLHLLRAEGEQLPFPAASLDAIVCGGSLNEFWHAPLVVQEAARVLKPGAPFFSMHLLTAESAFGRLAQTLAGGGGLHFWDEQSAHDLFSACGLQVERSRVAGVVAFALYRKTA